MATSLIWDTAAWRDSLARLQDLRRRTDADVLLGHDLGQFEELS